MIKSILGLTATTMAFGVLSVSIASADTLGFGSLPGGAGDNGGNPYSGTGISYASSAYDVINVPGDELTIALSTTGRGATAPTPTSTGANGAGTFYVTPGSTSSSGVNYALWDVDFWIGLASGSSLYSPSSFYSFNLTATDLGTGQTISANPLLIGDNVGGPGGAGNSENLNFGFLFGTSFDPNANDTIDFTLTAVGANGSTLGTVTDTTIVGTGVPDATSTAGILAASFAGLVSLKRKFAKN